MKLRGLFPFLFGGLAVIGCLPDPEPVDGTLVHAGSSIEKPRFELFDVVDPATGMVVIDPMTNTPKREPWVVFGIRKSLAANGYGARVDLYRVRWDDGASLPGTSPVTMPGPRIDTSQVIVTDYVDRAEWGPAIDQRKVRYYMKDERAALDAGAAAVGTLNRVSLTHGVLETIPDVISFSLNGAGTMMQYRRYVPGSRFQELRLRNLDGQERSLGLATGQAQFSGDNFYYITGEDRVLTRIAGLDGAPEMLRNRVSRYMLRGDQRFAIIAVSEMDKVRTLVLDLETKAELPVPVENPCCWMSFNSNTFNFSDSAKPGQRATLHAFDIDTKQDRVLTMPEGLDQVGLMISRPPDGKETLILDNDNQMAVYRPEVDPEVRLTNLRPVQPVFTEDGRYLLSIDPDPPPPTPTATPIDMAGRLMVQDANDYTLPAKAISPTGASVPIQPRGFFTTRNELFPLVFWAHYGFGASDLYFANHETGMVTKVAEGISEVTVTQRRVVGVVRVSLQDLTGDLVQKDLMTGEEQLLAHGVSETAIYGNRIVFLVRDRLADSQRNGLWGRTLPELGAPAGTVMAMPPAGAPK